MRNLLLVGILLSVGCVGPKPTEAPPTSQLISKATTVDAVYQPPVYVQWQGETWEVIGRDLQNGFVVLRLGIRGTHAWLEKEVYISEYSLLHQ